MKAKQKRKLKPRHVHNFVDKGVEPFHFTGVVWWRWFCSCGAMTGYVCGDYAKGLC